MAILDKFSQYLTVLDNIAKQAGAELCQAQVRLSQLFTCLDVAVVETGAEDLDTFPDGLWTDGQK